ncbi:MAG: glycosyltransferase [Chlorobium sp.]|jgi:glycosyltransferase involved in cell wall biosynthesis|nr:glycosyltransferase [Chlorobium sp.]
MVKGHRWYFTTFIMTFGYYALTGTEHYHGVCNKLRGIVNAAEKLGYTSTLHSVIGSGILSFIKLAIAISRAKEEIVFVRGVPYCYLLISPAMLIARLRHRKVYLDVPTPLIVAFQEILTAKQGIAIKVLKCFLIAIIGPMAFWPVHVVIQYAPEGKYFQIGNRKKIRIISNGIDIDAIAMRSSAPFWPSNSIHFLGVANVSDWHGYDRIIKGMAHYRDTESNPIPLYFTVVGSGPAIDDLKKLCISLHLFDQVIFTGPLTGKRLVNEYCKAHLAVDAIGIHRKGLSVASTLKSREYCALGISFIASAQDYDFDGNETFRYRVSSTDNYHEIAMLFAEISALPFFLYKEQIREFAEKKLSWESKLQQLGIDRCVQ